MYSALFPVTRRKPQPLTFCLHTDPKSNEAIGHFRERNTYAKAIEKASLAVTANHPKSLNSIKTYLTWWHSDVTGCNGPTPTDCNMSSYPSKNFFFCCCCCFLVCGEGNRSKTKWLLMGINNLSMDPDHGWPNAPFILTVQTCCGNRQRDNAL